ncbi:hypothetical protein BJX96DRAFT_49193, partial [Aspergillus floccosus]
RTRSPAAPTEDSHGKPARTVVGPCRITLDLSHRSLLFSSFPVDPLFFSSLPLSLSPVHSPLVFCVLRRFGFIFNSVSPITTRLLAFTQNPSMSHSMHLDHPVTDCPIRRTPVRGGGEKDTLTEHPHRPLLPYLPDPPPPSHSYHHLRDNSPG